MPVEAQTVEYSYIGDGVTTSFPFPSKFLAASHILVGVNGVPVSTGFNVTGAGAETGGIVTFTSAPALGAGISFLRAPPASQLTDFVNGQTVLESILDGGLDKLTMLVQYLLRGMSRTVRLGDFDPVSSALVLPDATARANKVMAFDAAGNATFALPAGTALPTLLASQAEALAGTDNTKLMTPLRTAQAVAGPVAILSKRKTLASLGVNTSNTDQSAAYTAGVAALSDGDYIDGQNQIIRIDQSTFHKLGVHLSALRFNIENVPINTYPFRMQAALGTVRTVTTALAFNARFINVSSTAGWLPGDRLKFTQQCAFPVTIAAVNPNVSLDLTIDNSARYAASSVASIAGLHGVVSIINPTTIRLNMIAPSTGGLSPSATVYMLRRAEGFAVDQAFNTWNARIRSIVSPTQVELEYAYPYAYTIPAVDLTVRTMARSPVTRIDDVGALRTPGVNFTHFFRGDDVANVRWRGGEIEGPNESARAWLGGCQDNTVTETYVANCSQDGYGYPDLVGNGNDDMRHFNNKFINPRHFISIGATGGIDRNIKSYKNRVSGSAMAGADAHPNCDMVLFEDNDIEVLNGRRDTGENTEGIVMQGANMRCRNNTIRGVASIAPTRNAAAVLIQPLTTHPDETFEVVDNDMKDFAGAGVHAILVDVQKPAGTINGPSIKGNKGSLVGFGGNGVLSPLGINVEVNANCGATLAIRHLDMSFNSMYSRTTAMRVATAPNKQIFMSTLTGNNLQTLNSDAPVLQLASGTAGLIERTSLTGNNLFGGSFGIQESNTSRTTRIGGTIGGFATAAISGTVTQPAGAVNEINT